MDASRRRMRLHRLEPASATRPSISTGRSARWGSAAVDSRSILARWGRGSHSTAWRPACARLACRTRCFRLGAAACWRLAAAASAGMWTSFRRVDRNCGRSIARASLAARRGDWHERRRRAVRHRRWHALRTRRRSTNGLAGKRCAQRERDRLERGDCRCALDGIPDRRRGTRGTLLRRASRRDGARDTGRPKLDACVRKT